MSTSNPLVQPQGVVQQLQTMPLEKFIRNGYYQEANRQFFHPLGLSLVVEVMEHEGEKYTVIYVADCRHHPEGVVFDNLGDDDKKRAVSVQCEQTRRRIDRKEILGYTVQPIPSKADADEIARRRTDWEAKKAK